MRSYIKACLIIVLAVFVLYAKAQYPKYTLQIADSLYRQYKLDDSYNAYRSIANRPENGPNTRIKAYLQLANQDWKFNHNYDDAFKILQIASTLKTDLYSIKLAMAVASRQAGKYAAAKLYADESLRLAKSANEKTDAGIAFAGAINDWNFNHQVADAAVNHKDLIKAALILGEALEKQPGNSDASELLVGIGMFLNNGELVLKGLRSYYLISDEGRINQAIAPGFKLLKQVLIDWKGKSLSTTQMATLAVGLADAKFFNYADYIIAAIKKKAPLIFNTSKELQDVAAYAAYINNVHQVNDRIYPQVANGKTKYENEYDSLMNRAGKVLWNKLSYIKKGGKFDPDTLYDILNRRFGTEGYTGTTVNYYGMLMGHIIHKELKEINQYGYSTKFTYISVDRLISRDFTSWYGTTNVGGWGDSTTIIQVRKAYMTEPFQLLNWMTDSTAKKSIPAQIAQMKQADLEVCKKDPYAEPKFLALYLKYNEASKIYKRLTGSGLKGMELNIAFVDEILKLTIASTVFAHEGRHAIDQLYFPQEFKAMSDDERELRAKYSEVIYSLNPKMAFTGSILGSNLGANTNHGKANQRFCKLIADWMATHQTEISGLDKDVPLLMQFDLLTNDQLIAICKSGDPLAGKGRN
ncbi:MAG: hypothetical protein ABI113_13065 [Mucilaginibacter sp.]